MRFEKVRSDFDRIACLDSDGWNHNRHYYPYLLEQVPIPCSEALEIGCGTGSFTRLIARRVDHVLALDLSPEMIKVAQQRSMDFSNIDYLVADALNWDYPPDRFDFVVSIAAFHHLPLGEILTRLKLSLRSGGILVVLDLVDEEGIKDYSINLIAIPTHLILRLIKTGRLRDPADVRAAWAEHSKIDHFLPLSEVRSVCRFYLPGAIIKRHLLWRFSIVWKKPVDGGQLIG